MAASAQARFDKLFANKSKPEKPKQDDLHFSERELLAYQQRQQKTATFPSNHIIHDEKPCAEEDESVRAQAPAKPNQEKPSHNDPQATQLGNRQQVHVPRTNPDQVVYLPKGVWRGGLAATQIEDDGPQRDIEPVSSSYERIGHFCVWPLVAKFPYKYMQDPEGKVSRRFFASEKIFERNWKV